MNQLFVKIRARVRRRLKYGLIAGVFFGTVAVVTQWLGLPTKYRPVNYPHPLSEIWWYFPVGGALGFVLVLLMPKGFDKDLGL
jgi:hypothetical protein